MGSGDLSKFELIVLKGISLGFDYKKLAKTLRVDEQEVVEAIKTLIKKGYVRYHEKRIGGELKLTKKGYEMLAQYGSGVRLEKSEVQEKPAKEEYTQPIVVQKSGSKLKKVVIASVVLFFIFAIVLPRLPVLLTAMDGSGVGGVIKPLEIHVTSFSVKSIDMSGLKGTMYLKVRNPNPIPAVIDGITYNIYDEDGNLLAQGEVPRTYTVPKESTITIQSDISVGWVGAFHIIKNKIKSWITGEEEIWTVEGIIYVNVGITTFDIPFSTQFKV